MPAKGQGKWVCGYRFGIDPVSGKSLHHASFLLRHFIPLELVRDEAHQKIIEGDLEESYPCIIQMQNSDKQWSFKTGSRAEGLGVPDHWLGDAGKKAVAADRDEMVCTPNWFKMDVPPEAYQHREGPMFVVESLGDDPNSKNFGRLRTTDQFRAANLAVGKPLTKTYFSNLPLKESIYKDKAPFSGQYSVELHGPSVSLVGHHLGPMLDRDECISIAFAGWPSVAEEWVTRHRSSGWPSKLLITDLSGKGYFMVPVGRHSSPDTDLEWRYSFSLAERSLARSLSPIVRKVYVILKMLHSFFLKEPGVLPTYAMKTTLFWFCETHDVSQWTEGDMASLVYCLLDEMLIGLARREIRHYFIPCVNLLARAPTESITTLARKMKYVRENLIECITTIAGKVNFWGLLSFKHFTWMSNYNSFRRSANSPLDMELFKGVTKDLLQDVFNEYVRLIRISEDNSDAGTTGFLKQAYRQRFLRILRTIVTEMRTVSNSSLSFGEFLLSKLSECDQGTWVSEAEHVLAKIFQWLYMDSTKDRKPNQNRLLGVCQQVRDIDSGNLLTDKACQRLEKIAEHLKDSEIPVSHILTHSYSLFKQYFITENAVTRHTAINLIGEQIGKLPNQSSVNLPQVNTCMTGDTIFKNSNRGGRVCCYSFGLDPQSGTSLHHASFILRHFLPLELVRDETQQKIIESDNSERMAKVIDPENNSESELAKGETLMTGSLAEGLGVPDYHYFPSGGGGFEVKSRDRDEMIIERNWYQMKDIPLEFEHYREGPLFEVEAVEGGEANYARLKFTNCYKIAKEAVSGREVKAVYFNNYSAKEQLLNIYTNLPFDAFPNVEVHGPCVTLLGDSSGGVERDNCISIAFKEWPVVASEWLTRQRPSGWPSKTTIRDISQKGFCMVPMGRHNVENAELEWRYSFSIQERILARSLPPIVRKAYILLKMLHSFYLKEPGVLPTYCLKTLLFWMCEEQQVSQWTEADMAGLLYCLLDRLLQALVRHEIRHYFIPGVNLLKQAPRDHINTLSKTLTRLRHNLIDPIIAIARKVSFLGLGGGRFFTTLPGLGAFLTSMKTPMDASLFEQASHDLNSDILQQYVDRIRANERVSEKGTIYLIKQANHRRFLHILHDVVLEMQLAEKFEGSYKTFLLLNLSKLSEDPLLLAKIYVWLGDYHVQNRTALPEMNKYVADRSSTEELVTTVCDLILEKQRSTENQQIKRVKEIQQRMIYPGVVGLDLSTDSSSLYKQYHGQQTAETLQPIVDLHSLPTLSVGPQPKRLQIDSKRGIGAPLANPFAALGNLLGSMPVAPVSDIESLLKASQEMFKWVKEQQKLHQPK